MRLVVDVPDDVMRLIKEGCLGTEYNIHDISNWLINGYQMHKRNVVDVDLYCDRLKEIRHDEDYYDLQTSNDAFEFIFDDLKHVSTIGYLDCKREEEEQWSY